MKLNKFTLLVVLSILLGITACGEIGSNEDSLFIKIDPEGNELWTSTFGDPEMIDYGMVLAETADGGCVAARACDGPVHVECGHLTGQD
jgi:hypothetical protein